MVSGEGMAYAYVACKIIWANASRALWWSGYTRLVPRATPEDRTELADP